MKEKIVSYEIAKIACEKGFTHMKANIYGNNLHYEREEEEKEASAKQGNVTIGTYLAPSLSLLQRWLRDVHLININITSSSLESYTLCITSHADTITNLSFEDMKTEDHKCYEDALEYGLEQALNLLEDE